MPTITFSHTGTTLEVAEGAAFIEACQAADAPANFGCTVGSCGTCAMVVEAGAENLSPSDDEEMETVEMVTAETGARLGCQGKVLGDITVRPAE